LFENVNQKRKLGSNFIYGSDANPIAIRRNIKLKKPIKNRGYYDSFKNAQTLKTDGKLAEIKPSDLLDVAFFMTGGSGADKDNFNTGNVDKVNVNNCVLFVKFWRGNRAYVVQFFEDEMTIEIIKKSFSGSWVDMLRIQPLKIELKFAEQNLSRIYTAIANGEARMSKLNSKQKKALTFLKDEASIMRKKINSLDHVQMRVGAAESVNGIGIAPAIIIVAIIAVAAVAMFMWNSAPKVLDQVFDTVRQVKRDSQRTQIIEAMEELAKDGITPAEQPAYNAYNEQLEALNNEAKNDVKQEGKETSSIQEVGTIVKWTVGGLVALMALKFLSTTQSKRK
jgi:hypothetical protein